jgi:sporulation protein YlmC with PRC-barrel domain
MNTQAGVLSISSIKGNRVVNPQGEDLGNIEELMIEMGAGRIAYAVLSFGGFLGLGDKYFAIPWEALSLNIDNKTFLLSVPKEKLDKARGFDKDNWPDMADQRWGSEIHSYYGYKPYWESSVETRR